MLLVVLGRRKLDIQKRDLLAVTCLTWAPHLYAIKFCATLKVRSKLSAQAPRTASKVCQGEIHVTTVEDYQSQSLNTRGWLL